MPAPTTGPSTGSSSRRRRHRESLTATSCLSARDKDELKQKCLLRVRQERSRLVARLRQERMGMVAAQDQACPPDLVLSSCCSSSGHTSSASSKYSAPTPAEQHQQHLSVTARDILNEGLRAFEIRAIASGAAAGAESPDAMADSDAEAGSGELAQRPHRRERGAEGALPSEGGGASASGSWEGDWGDDDETADETASMCRELTPEEYVDMMIFVEQALAAELARADASAEHAAIEEYEALQALEGEERAEALARAAAEAEDGGGWGDNEVLCPVCKGGWLLQQGGTIMCTCGFRLPVSGEGLQLGVLREALAEVFSDHRARCHLQPTFGVREEWGVPMLWGECATCDFQQIVM